MAAVSWHVVMSLDGFIAGPGDDMGWIFEVAGPSETVDETIRATGAIVMGPRTYEVEDRDRHGVYGGAWNGPLVQVAPVLLGDGVRLFESRQRPRITLDKAGVSESGPLTDLRFRVVR